jgi:hypothetical protein
MNRVATPTLTSLVTLCLALALPIGEAVAQQMQRVSFKTSAVNTKYTQQHLMDVGDFPGHQVRIYELHRTFPTNPPMISGVAIKEQWTRALSDYTDNSGPGTTYGVYVLENGDKFFTRSALISQNTGGGKLSATTVGQITGGTGKLIGIQGTIRTVNTADPKAGFNEGQTEIEYAIGK